MAIPFSLLPFAMLLVILPFPGTVAARLLLLLSCFSIALWQWFRIPGSRTRIPCKPALAGWIVVCAASLMYAANTAYTQKELQNELGYTMMAFFAFFAFTRDRHTAVLLLRALVAGLFLIGGWAVVDWMRIGFAWNDSRGYGGIGAFSTYVVTILPALLWLSLSEKASAWRRMAVSATLFALFLAVMTKQRAVWPVIALQMIGTATLLTLTHSWSISRRQLAVVAIAVAAIGFLGLFFNHQHRVKTVPATSAAMVSDDRVRFWPDVIATIGQHPLIGAGFGRGSMSQAYPELAPDYNGQLRHPHNLILNYGIGMGVPGILTLLFLFGSFAIFFWQGAAGTAAVAGIAGLTMVAGVVLRNQFNDFFMRDLSILFWALTGIFARLVVNATQGKLNDQQTPT